jgi:type IV pilus assembly protein PilY1
MHKSFKRRSMKWAFAGLMLVPGGFNMAALTDLADLPVAILMASGTATIKHNLMFTLDDSGSMGWNYTPDYVIDEMCFDSKDDDGLINNSLDRCIPGDPPYMSPDFNAQYYNPDIYYQAPIKGDHTKYPDASISAAYHDPFNIQKTDMLGKPTSDPVDLRNSWPDRQWCDSGSGGNCVVNSSGYTYPNNIYAYGHGKSGCTTYGGECVNYTKNSAPYYWRIEESEYCTDEELTNCGPIKLTGVRDEGATMRWCTNSTLSDCQARQLPGYDYPRLVGQWTGTSVTKAKYTIQVTSVSRNVIFSGTLSVKLTADDGSVYDFYTGNFSGTTLNSSNSTDRRNDMAAKLLTKLNALGKFNIARSGDTVIIEAINSGPAYNGTFTETHPSPAGSWKPTSQIVGGRDKVYTMRRYNIDTSENWPDKKPGTRPDCKTLPNKCTYAEESRNFANWYSYYRTRMQAMKSAVSIAFDTLDDKLRIGFNSISYTGTTNGSKFLLNAPFDATQRSAWYSKLFASNPSSTTPLRTSLKKIGEMFSLKMGVNPYDSDPNKARCQRNFSLLTTDGYWNDDGQSRRPNFSGFGNFDNSLSDSFIGPRSLGRFDGGANGAADTLADVAAYYYKTDLVPSMPDYVESHGEQATKIKFQNMTTHTLGLGVSGVLRYTKNYENSGDFKKIKDGVAGQCLWSSTCDWPKPVSGTLTAVDDLWHAAVNGGGKYFSARNPADLVTGLKKIVDDIKKESGSGAAASTSTPNITSSDNWAFSATYSVEPANQDWFGDLMAEKIDVDTGDLISGTVWSARQLLQANTSRRLFTFDSGSAAPRSFAWGSLTATEQGYFSGKGSLLTQYATLAASDQITLDSGAKVFSFVAGDQTGIGSIFRNRNWLLGDIVHSRPAYVRVPSRGYTDSGYSSFVNSKLTRKGALYVGANDGMIHALRG